MDLVAAMEGIIFGLKHGHVTMEILTENPKNDEPMGQLDSTNAKVSC